MLNEISIQFLKSYIWRSLICETSACGKKIVPAMATSKTFLHFKINFDDVKFRKFYPILLKYHGFYESFCGGFLEERRHFCLPWNDIKKIILNKINKVEVDLKLNLTNV